MTDPDAPARRVRGFYRTNGLRRRLAKLLRAVASRVAATVYSTHVELVIVKSLHDTTQVIPQDGLLIREITKHDVALITAFNERHRARESVIASQCYVKNGYRGFLAFRGGEVAGYWWWVNSEANAAITHPCINRLELDVKDHELYGFDYFIAPPYRDGGLAVKCLALMYRELRDMGYRTVWAYVDASNTAARWVYQSLGNRVVKRITSHEVLSVLLFQDRRVFVRNSRRNLTHGFDRRMVASWRTDVPKRPRAA